MEKTIKEIENAEAKARDLIESANCNAAEIQKTVEAEIALLKSEYEQKLLSESEAAALEAKEKAARIFAAENESSSAKADKIKRNAHGRIEPCADFVYDYIIKEFTK